MDTTQIIVQINTLTTQVQALQKHTHNGVDSLIISSANLATAISQAGVMLASVYDPAGIDQQLVGLTAIQTLTNKTLTSPVLTAPTINGSINAVTALSGTTPTINCAACNIFTLTMSGNTTYSISNASAGQVFMVEVTQGSGTTYTNTWFSTVTWVTSGGTAPIETTVSGGITTYGFRVLTSSTFLGYLIGTN